MEIALALNQAKDSQLIKLGVQSHAEIALRLSA